MNREEKKKPFEFLYRIHFFFLNNSALEFMNMERNEQFYVPIKVTSDSMWNFLYFCIKMKQKIICKFTHGPLVMKFNNAFLLNPVKKTTNGLREMFRFFKGTSFFGTDEFQFYNFHRQIRVLSFEAAISNSLIEERKLRNTVRK